MKFKSLARFANFLNISFNNQTNIYWLKSIWIKEIRKFKQFLLGLGCIISGIFFLLLLHPIISIHKFELVVKKNQVCFTITKQLNNPLKVFILNGYRIELSRQYIYWLIRIKVEHEKSSDIAAVAVCIILYIFQNQIFNDFNKNNMRINWLLAGSS